ncbi:MAG: D-sedoheptulose 7-phosphate isomerase [Desulfuromonadia bacterium]
MELLHHTSSIHSHLDAHLELIDRVRSELSPAIASLADALGGTLARRRSLLVFGNGGSAADAQHFAAEIVGRFKRERSAWPAIALTTDSSILTAIGNDYGFDRVFSRQVEALGRPGDLVVGISTSGNSENVRQGLVVAREIGCRTAALLGRDGGVIRDLVDIPIVIPSHDTPRIQEAHSLIIHIVCDLVEEALCGEFRD